MNQKYLKQIFIGTVLILLSACQYDSDYSAGESYSNIGTSNLSAAEESPGLSQEDVVTSGGTYVGPMDDQQATTVDNNSSETTEVTAQVEPVAESIRFEEATIDAGSAESEPVVTTGPVTEPTEQPAVSHETQQSSTQASAAAETSSTVVTANNQNSPFGTNISSIRDWETGQMFVDVFKAARPFHIHSPQEIVYDADGWPKNLNGKVARTYLLTNIPTDAIPTGRYSVLYDGKGTIKYHGHTRLVKRESGKDIINVAAGEGTMILEVTNSDPNNHIRNIRVIMPGGICESNPLQHASAANDCPNNDYLDYETHHETIRFNPDFLRYLTSFKVLRFMDMQDTNHSYHVNWQDMTSLSNATWAPVRGDKKGGAPIEVMVDMANRVNADVWFCMPHQATDDYVREFSDYVRDNLKPGSKAYVEYSNEVWNSIFPQSSYALEQGVALNLDPSPHTAKLKYFGKRSLEIFKIWEDSFKGTNRLVRVMSAQAANAWASKTVLEVADDIAKEVDALAIAPYFGGDPTPFRQATNVSDIFAKLRDPNYDQSFQKVMEKVRQHAEVADKSGVDLISYEGGQHLVDWTTSKDDDHPNLLFYAANSDPQMGALYKEYFQAWKEAGGKLFIHFSSPSRWAKYGSWGIKQHLNENDSPKHDAIMEFIDSNPKWW